MSISMYVTKTEPNDELLNRFGEKGWLILMITPMVLYKEKQFDENSELTLPFLNRIEEISSSDKQYRKALRESGIEFRKIHCDDGRKKYALSEKSRVKLSKWRIEVNASDTTADGRGIVYMTFGDPSINFPAIINAKMIDDYFGEEINEISDLVEKAECEDYD